MKFRKTLLMIAAICLSSVAFAQDVDCETAYSLYREAFKQWEAAKPKCDPKNVNPVMVSSWRTVFLNCPEMRQSTFTDGAKIVTNAFIKNAKNDKEREAYIDTLCMVYDLRAKYFPDSPKGPGTNVSNVLGRKGIDLMAYPSRLETAYTSLKQAIELEGNLANNLFIDGYFKTVINMVKAGKLEESEIIEEYSRLMDIVDNVMNNINEYGYEKIAADYEKTKNNLEGAVQPYANCEDLIRIYQKKYDVDPDNVELLNKIATVLSARNCDKSDLYLAVAVKLHKLNPSAESAYFIGKRYLVDQEYGKATSYLLEATKSDNTVQAEQSYKYLAQIMLKESNFEQGRIYANRAIALDKTDGEPYMIIGYLYASSGKVCNENPLHSKAVLWAAVDKFQKAKEVDPEQAAKANEMIREYSKMFPTSEDAFFYNVFEGDTYHVGCWINEDTKARFSNSGN